MNKKYLIKSFKEEIKETGYLKEIDDISKKVLENKIILFLGAGFSCNFGLPTWKELIKEIIVRGIRINESRNFIKENEVLGQIKEALDTNNLSLLGILDTILENIPSLGEEPEGKSKFLGAIYKEHLSIEKYLKDSSLNKKQKVSLNIRFLIDKFFNKILTINYDDIFYYSNDKEINQRWKYLNERIETPNNQPYAKWVYPIHGTIVKSEEDGINLPIIDSYFSFIDNWRKKDFIDKFEKLLENSINDEYIFLFIGCSFNDNFVLSEIAAFINKNGFFNKERILFYVLWDDIKVIEETEKHDIDQHKFVPLSKHWGSVKFIKLSSFSKNSKIKIDSKSGCITNFFKYLESSAHLYEKNSMLLNNIENVKFSEIIKDKFDIEKYFIKIFPTTGSTKLVSLADEEIIFILSLYNQKKWLIEETKKEEFPTFYYKCIIIFWDFVINNKLGSIKIKNFIKNSESFIDMFNWASSQSNKKFLIKLGEIYND